MYVLFWDAISNVYIYMHALFFFSLYEVGISYKPIMGFYLTCTFILLLLIVFNLLFYKTF